MIAYGVTSTWQLYLDRAKTNHTQKFKPCTN